MIGRRRLSAGHHGRTRAPARPTRTSSRNISPSTAVEYIPVCTFGCCLSCQCMIAEFQRLALCIAEHFFCTCGAQLWLLQDLAPSCPPRSLHARPWFNKSSKGCLYQLGCRFCGCPYVTAYFFWVCIRTLISGNSHVGTSDVAVFRLYLGHERQRRQSGRWTWMAMKAMHLHGCGSFQKP